MHHHLSIAAMVLNAAFSGPTLAEGINSFSQVRAAVVETHVDAPGTFYCECKINWRDKKGVVDLQPCDYQVRKNENRTDRVEWEHVAPIWQFGRQYRCWQDDGHKNYAKDPVYRKMESDMYNLQLSIDEVNDDHGNFMYSQWNGDKGQYGQCAMKVDFRERAAEPPARVRDATARTYLYMCDRYNLTLSHQQTQLFSARSKVYPVTDWGHERDECIAKVQGNHNPCVQRVCQVRKN